MKKIISLALSAVMCAGTGFTAFAANNGPKEPDPNSPYISAVISLFEFDKTQKMETDNFYRIFGTDGTNNNAFKGVSYDKSSNTLTLSNVNAENFELVCNEMGDDFKIKVVGNCSLGEIYGFTEGWADSFTFTGNGTLDINKDKFFNYGVVLSASEKSVSVNFDTNVKVNIYGKTSASITYHNKQTDVSKVYTFNGKHNAELKTEKIYDINREWAIGYYPDFSPTPDYLGPAAKCTDDPEGTYIMGDYYSTDQDGNRTEEGHWVSRLLYSNDLKMYLYDTSFAANGSKNIPNTDPEYQKYISAEGSVYNNNKKFELFSHYDVMTDENGKEYAYGHTWNSDIEEMYPYVVTFTPVSDVKGEYIFKILYEGKEAKNFAEKLTSTNKTINGAIISDLEPERDWLGEKLRSKDDPNGNYFLTTGSRYENYGTEDEKEIPTYWIKKYIYIEKYNIYIQDRTFQDGKGEIELSPEDFATCGYELVLDENGKKIGVNNNCDLKQVNGNIYNDKDGNKYIVHTENSQSDEKTSTVYSTEFLPEISDNYNTYYLVVPTDAVKADDLTIYEERKEIKGAVNHSIANTDFTYNGIETPDVTPTVTKTNISKCTISGIKSSVTYTGKALTQKITVKYGKKTLKNNTDYKITYSSNKNVGKATVTITGKGNYTGKVSKTFSIIPKGTTLSKLKAGKKSFTASWKKNTAQTSGYQLQYSLKSNFKSAKTLAVNKNKTTSTSVKKLSAKKKYYVRIRTFKKVSGKTYYSAWSKAKTVKTK